MVEAMEAVISNIMGVNHVAASCIVPSTMLKNRISGCVKHGAPPGPQSYLSPEKESELAEFRGLLTRWAMEKQSKKLFKV